MIPGPDIYYKCPTCGAYLYTHSLTSGNTFGAKTYSDGKMVAPMLPEYPNLTKCENCETIVMLSRLEQIIEDDSRKEKKRDDISLLGKILRLFSRTKTKNIEAEHEGELQERQDINSPFVSRYECMHLGLGDLYKALDVFPNDELYIRLKIWRKHNDILRFSSELTPENIHQDILDYHEYMNNCRSLLNLLNKEDDDERLIMAELNRNLGNFTECLDLITKSEGRRNLIETILTLECEKGNRCIVRVDNYFEILAAEVKQEAERKEQERINEEKKDPRWKVCPNGHCFENIRTECNWCGEKEIVDRLDKDISLQHKELYVGKRNGHYVLTTDSNIPMQEERIRKITVDYYQDKFIYFHLDGKNPNPFHFNVIRLNEGCINGRILTKLCEDIITRNSDIVDISSYINNVTKP